MRAALTRPSGSASAPTATHTPKDEEPNSDEVQGLRRLPALAEEIRSRLNWLNWLNWSTQEAPVG
jgi:hypothetical protein